ncbi:hypothetical protein [Dyadobacter aurulentus]|uniref:hypothetical protein n=1 Tax=Dyadobacter sp. UC 10 TaxID=2605428 RepID=UPI0011F2369E|nr:hypothetical protein [Dyadobacter sp. UC 10]KAA0989551.1 hypothetical protein FXO21_04920 [Dyadobacter sp. UC 10]
MRQLLLFALLGTWFLVGNAYGQIQKGTGYVGGTISFDGETSRSKEIADPLNSARNTRHGIAPEIQFGKMIGERTMLGLGVRYNMNWNRTKYDETDISSSQISQGIALLPFIRQYKSLGSSNWSVFLHGELGPQFQWIKKTNTQGSTPETERRDFWQYGLSVKPGIAYVSRKNGWAIEGYADILSLSANYVPSKNEAPSVFTLQTGIATSFPNVITLRVAKYIFPKN